jgi:hypothetical protein
VVKISIFGGHRLSQFILRTPRSQKESGGKIAYKMSSVVKWVSGTQWRNEIENGSTEIKLSWKY